MKHIPCFEIINKTIASRIAFTIVIVDMYVDL